MLFDRVICGQRILRNMSTSLKDLCTYRKLSDAIKSKEDSQVTKDQAKRKWLEEAIIYIHWPYCKKKCTYCNFNKYVSYSVDHERMRDCLVKEIKTLVNLSGVKRIRSIFFGGGTPSLAEPRTIQSVIQSVRDNTQLNVNAEITLEANPTSAESSKLRDFRDAGINRLSLGVQSLNNDDLKILGRQHSVDEALMALSQCQDLFPGSTSIDVIFGRPGHKVDGWKSELNNVLNLGVDHLSLYQLTLERGTALFRQIMDRELHLPDPEKVADMYHHSVETLENNGYRRYEVSNFAKSKSTESVHNKGYWSSCQYIGIGPGAHGHFVPQLTQSTTREARVQALVPETWMDAVESSGHGTARVIKQSTLNILEEVIMLSMRTADGLHQKDWEIFTDMRLKDIFGETYMTKMLCEEGYLHMDQESIRATSKGLNVADALTRELLNILQIFME